MAGLLGAYQSLLTRRPMLGNILTSAVSPSSLPPSLSFPRNHHQRLEIVADHRSYSQLEMVRYPFSFSRFPVSSPLVMWFGGVEVVGLTLVIAQQGIEKKGKDHDFARTG